MKTRLAILAVLAATAGVSTAYAGTIPAPTAPTPGPGAAPVLFPSEQGAFKGLEVAKQLVESYILQNGCDDGVYFDLKVKTNAAGAGWVYLDGVSLAITTDGGSYEGRRYDITGSGILGDLAVSDVVGHGSYNIGSEMQELTTTWLMDSPYSDEQDDFRGTIIKDYWRLDAKQPIPGNCETPIPSVVNGSSNYFSNACTRVSTVIDYGYQQIQKHDYIAAKWWQQSQAWRQNGTRSGTYWKVARVAPYGDACQITVKLQGTPGAANTANKQGFNQVGVIEVGVDGGPTPGGWYKN